MTKLNCTCTLHTDKVYMILQTLHLKMESLFFLFWLKDWHCYCIGGLLGFIWGERAAVGGERGNSRQGGRKDGKKLKQFISRWQNNLSSRLTCCGAFPTSMTLCVPLNQHGWEVPEVPRTVTHYLRATVCKLFRHQQFSPNVHIYDFYNNCLFDCLQVLFCGIIGYKI